MHAIARLHRDLVYYSHTDYVMIAHAYMQLASYSYDICYEHGDLAISGWRYCLMHAA